MKRQMIVPILVLMVAAATVGAQEKPRLGVLPFTGGSGRDGDSIANLFANSRELREEFSIVPRTSSITAVMREQQFQRSGLTDSDTIAELGKQMNADYVVSGHIASLGNSNLLLISIVDVQTMRQVAGDYQEYDRIEAIRDLLPSMAGNIISSVQGQVASSRDALAVLPLNIEDTAVKQEDAEILAQILATEIVNSRAYAVFPRTRTIETVMAEQRIQNSGLTDRESMIAIGKATNADYVLAGSITKLGQMNLFVVSILNIKTGEQVEGADQSYTNVADGIDLMAELAYGLTGVTAGRYAENRQRERLAADAERQRQEYQQKQQNEEDFKNAVAEFFLGEQRFTSLGVNVGMGFGHGDEDTQGRYEETEKLDFNSFVNINATIPLVWYLFAEVGMDIGFAGSISENGEYSSSDNEKKFSLTRPYVRLDIGIPLGDRDFLTLLYAGVGFGWTNASYEYMGGSYNYYSNYYERSTQTATLEYSAADLVFGCFVSWEHHGLRFSINLNNISQSDYFEVQMSAGYMFRF